MYNNKSFDVFRKMLIIPITLILLVFAVAMCGTENIQKLGQLDSNKEQLKFTDISDSESNTSSQFVKFNAYYLADYDRDGKANKVKNTYHTIGEKDKLYMELQVLTDGYIKNGKIAFNNKNIKIENEIMDDDVAYINEYSNVINYITLKNISNGTQKLIIADFSSEIKNMVGNNINDYSADNSLTFTCDYVANDGTITKISKQVTLHNDWYGTATSSIYQFNTIQSVYIPNIARNDTEQIISIPMNIKTYEDDEQLILKDNVITGQIPKVCNVLPKRIEANASVSYDSSTGKFTLKYESALDNAGNIVRHIDDSNDYNIKLIYNNHDNETYINFINTKPTIRIPVSTYYEGYNNKIFSNPYKSNIATATYSLSIMDMPNVRMELKGFYIGDISLETGFIIPKDNVLKKYNGVETNKFDEVNVDCHTTLKAPGKAEYLEYTNKLDYTSTNTEQLKDENGNTANIADCIKCKSISISGYDKILGDDGKVYVYDQDTNELLHTFDKTNWNNEYVYPTNKYIKRVKVKTTAVNIVDEKDFELYIYQKKEIDKNKIVSKFTLDQFNKYNKYLNGVNVAAKFSNYRDATNLLYTSKEANYMETFTNATFQVINSEYAKNTSKSNLLNIQSTNNDVYIDIGALNIGDIDSELGACKNPIFLIEFPEEIQNVNIKNIDVYPLYRGDAALNYYTIGKSNGKTYMKIYIRNSKPSTFRVSINASITVDPTISLKSDKINLYMYNPNKQNYLNSIKDIFDINDNKNYNEYIGTRDVEVRYNLPSTLKTINQITNYDVMGSVSYSPSIVKLNNSKMKNPVVTGIINNYYNESVKNIKVLGKVPFKGNRSQITNTELGSTFTAKILGPLDASKLPSDAKIYYSVNENVTKDLSNTSNGWILKEKVTDWSKVKTYLIDFGNTEMLPGGKYSFSYTLDVPYVEALNQVAYATHAIYFDIQTDAGLLSTNIETEKIGISAERHFDLMVCKNMDYTNAIIEGAKYSLEDSKGNIQYITVDRNNSDLKLNLNVNEEYKLKEITPGVIDNKLYVFKVVVNNDGSLTLKGIYGDINYHNIYDRPNMNSLIEIFFKDAINYGLNIITVDKQTGSRVKNTKYEINGGGFKNFEYMSDSDGNLNLKRLNLDVLYTIKQKNSYEYYCYTNDITFKLINQNGNLIVVDQNNNKIANTDNVVFESKISCDNNVSSSGNEYSKNNNLVAFLDITVKNIPVEKCNIKINDYVQNKNILIPNSTYRISGPGKDKNTYFTTDSNGSVIIPDVWEYINGKSEYNDRKYTIEQSSSPEGYITETTPINFVIENSNGTLIPHIEQGVFRQVGGYDDIKVNGNQIIFNLENAENFKLTKVDSDNNNIKLANVEFSIKLKNGGQAYDAKKNPISTIKTDANGEVNMGLPLGEYILIEKATNEQYILNTETHEFSIDYDCNPYYGETRTFNDYNINKEYEYTLDISELKNSKMIMLNHSSKEIEIELYDSINDNKKLINVAKIRKTEFADCMIVKSKVITSDNGILYSIEGINSRGLVYTDADGIQQSFETKKNLYIKINSQGNVEWISTFETDFKENQIIEQDNRFLLIGTEYYYATTYELSKDGKEFKKLDYNTDFEIYNINNNCKDYMENGDSYQYYIIGKRNVKGISDSGGFEMPETYTRRNSYCDVMYRIDIDKTGKIKKVIWRNLVNYNYMLDNENAFYSPEKDPSAYIYQFEENVKGLKVINNKVRIDYEFVTNAYEKVDQYFWTNYSKKKFMYSIYDEDICLTNFVESKSDEFDEIEGEAVKYDFDNNIEYLYDTTKGKCVALDLTTLDKKQVGWDPYSPIYTKGYIILSNHKVLNYGWDENNLNNRVAKTYELNYEKTYTAGNQTKKEVVINNTKKSYDINAKIVNGFGSISANLQGDSSQNVNLTEKDLNPVRIESVKYGESSKKDIVITPAKGYKVEKILINDVEQTFTENTDGKVVLNKLNGIINTKLIKVYIAPKEAKVNVHYYELIDNGNNTYTKTTKEISPMKTVIGKVTDDYSVTPLTNIKGFTLKNDANYMPTNATGVLVDNSNNNTIDVNYYYTRNPAKVIVHYYKENTTEKLTDDIVINGKYEDNYTTDVSRKLSQNYIFVSRTANYTGKMYESQTDVIYYYRVRIPNLTDSISLTGTTSILGTKQPVTYNITYNSNIQNYYGKTKIIVKDNLPYAIDLSKSNIAGGTYDSTKNTITWEQLVDINDANRNNIFNKKITVVYNGADLDDNPTILNTISGETEVLELSGYKVTKNATFGTTIDRTKYNINAEIIWQADAEYLRPENLTLVLKGNGNFIKQVNVDDISGWKKSLSKLSKYSPEGTELKYTIEQVETNEGDLKNYTSETKVSNVDLNTNYQFINKCIVPLKNLVVNKKWDDQVETTRPESVQFRVLANGTSYAIVTLKKSENWTKTIRVPSIDMNTKATCKYTIEEVANGDGYVVSNINYGEDVIDVTNKYTAPTLEKNLKVNWVINDVRYVYSMPDSVNVEILANGVHYKTVNVSKSNEWNCNLSLPKYEEGTTKLINYTLKESGLIDDFTATMDGFNITNTFTGAKVDKTVIKTWSNDTENTRPNEVTIELVADGVDTGKTIIINKAGSWKGNFVGVQKYQYLETGKKEINYTVKELTRAEGYVASVNGMNIVNTYTMPKVEKKVDVSWKNDNDGLRPQNLEVELVANNVPTGKKVILNRANNWQASFGNVNKYNSGTLNMINYSVKQNNLPEGYEASINGMNVVNSYSSPSISKTAIKYWKNDNPNMRPESVDVELLQNDNETGIVGKLTKENNWQYTFTNLQKYAGNTTVLNDYSIKELNTPDGYISEVSGMDITNTFTSPTVTKTVTKQWKNDNVLLRPDYIDVEILENNVPTGIIGRLTKSNDWEYTFNYLEKYVKGTSIEAEYSVRELNIPEGYEPQIDGMDIINSYSMPTVDKEVTKVWVNDDPSTRPQSIDVELLEDGEETDQIATLNQANGWKYTFKGLDKYYEGSKEEISYSVKELTNVIGYESKVEGMKITNTSKKAVVSKKVTCIWKNASEQIIPHSLNIEVLKNGIATGIKTTLLKENNWEYTFDNLEEYQGNTNVQNSYSVKVLDLPEGYETQINGMNIINSYVMPKVEKKVANTWVNDVQNIRPQSINVELIKNNAETGITAELTKENNWEYLFTDLDKYQEGTLVLNEYSIRQVDTLEGYTSKVEGMNIVNTYKMPTVSKTVTKTWLNDTEEIRPQSVEIELLANNNVTGTKVILNKANNWQYTFDSLPKYQTGTTVEINYSVKELSLSEGYTSKIEGLNIINTYEMPKISKEVKVIWNNDQESLRPENIEVELLQNNVETGRRILLNSDNNWKYTFDNLNKYITGSLTTANYSVKVISECEGYENSINGTEITNTYVRPKITKIASVTWGNDTDEIRPESLEVELTANDELTGKKVILNSENNWKYTFNELDKYPSDSFIENRYSLKVLTEYEGYTSVINGMNIVNNYSMPKVTKTATKKWANDDPSTRPENITIQLLVNGRDTTFLGMLSNENNWSCTFFNLDKYIQGTKKENVYSVKEINVPEGYTPTIDGMDILDTYERPSVTRTVINTWIDDNEIVRPENIDVELIKNNVPTGIIETLTSKNNWQYTFANLEKYKDINLKELNEYSIRQVSNIEGYEQIIDKMNIINKYSAPKIEKTIKEIWNNDNETVRPESVKVELLADGNDTGLIDTLSKANNWEVTFKNLNKYRDDNKFEIEYSVKELTQYEGYTSTINGTNIVNVYDTPKTSVKAIMTWFNDNEIQRPKNVKIYLLANGKETNYSGILNAENNWEVTFEDINKYNIGTLEEVKYSVVQEEQYEGYLSSIDGMNITNTYETPKINKNSEVIWKNDNETVRPDSIKIELIKNEIATGIYGTLTKENNWKYTFENIDKYNEGTKTEVSYTIKVVNEVEGYTSEVNGVNLVNTYIAPTVSKTVTSTWENDTRQLRPIDVEVELLANGNSTGIHGTLNEGNNWQYTFYDVSKYLVGTLNEIQYSVKQLTNIEGYINKVNELNIVNTYNMPKVNKTAVITWKNDNVRMRPLEIEVELVANNIPTGIKGLLSVDNNWKYTFENIDKYNDGTRKEIYYSAIILNTPEGYTPEIDGMNIVNTYEIPKISKTVNITWAGDNESVRPESIEVELIKNDIPTGIKATITKANNWACTFNDLDKYKVNSLKLNNYTIKEVNVPEGYVASINEMNITNTYSNDNSPVVSKTIVMKWSGDSNIIRPKNIRVELLADNKHYSYIDLNENSNWSYIAQDLEKYVEGTKDLINYTINDLNALEGYTTDIQYVDNNIIINNSYSMPMVNKSIVKTWYNDNESLRSEKTDVMIYANNKETNKVVTLNYDNNWKYTIDLPKYEAGTLNEISYSIKELNVSEGYISEINDFDIKNTYVEPTINIPIKIIWKDDVESLRPEEITVDLYANDKLTNRKIVITKDMNWQDQFVNVPKYMNGTKDEISYSYKISSEIGEGYNTVYDNLTIVNTYVEPVVSKTVQVEWFGDNIRMRPLEIKIELLVNGESKGLTYELNASNGWKYEFSNLAKYNKLTKEEISYELKGIDSIVGYQSVINGLVITNNHGVETIDKEVSNTWVSDTEEVRPESIKVKLYADGIDTGKEIMLNKENNWKASFIGLKKYKSNNLVETVNYSIEQENIAEGYTSKIDDFNITNSYLEPKKDILVSVIWNDKNNLYNKRPTSLKLEVKLDNQVVNEEEVYNYQNWYHIFEVQKYDTGTKNLRKYSVDEEKLNIEDMTSYTKEIRSNYIVNNYNN